MSQDLDSIVSRSIPPEPWVDGDKIPWNDPDFSERMLTEHLSQLHDAASRRTETIDAQVAWIQEELLDAKPARVLDLGCGPGLYTSRLADLGHLVRGIDFSPASIRYAREQAEADATDVTYELGDVRTADYGGPRDLVMFIFGELNVFRRADVATLLGRARQALRPGGQLLIEVHSVAAVREIGEQPPRAQALEAGLFSARPHDLLEESFWLEEEAVAVQRWFVVDRETDAVVRHAATTQAYSTAEYVSLLEAAGFSEAGERADWPSADGHEDTLTAYVAQA